jgi:hypothetical protein
MPLDKFYSCNKKSHYPVSKRRQIRFCFIMGNFNKLFSLKNLELFFKKMKLDLFNTNPLSSPCLMGWSWFYQTISLTVKRFPSINRTAKHEPLAFSFFQTLNRALAIRHLAKIMAMVKLREIKRQVLFTDMVKRSNHAALQETEICPAVRIASTAACRSCFKSVKVDETNTWSFLLLKQNLSFSAPS